MRMDVMKDALDEGQARQACRTMRNDLMRGRLLRASQPVLGQFEWQEEMHALRRQLAWIGEIEAIAQDRGDGELVRQAAMMRMDLGAAHPSVLHGALVRYLGDGPDEDLGDWQEVADRLRAGIDAFCRQHGEPMRAWSAFEERDDFEAVLIGLAICTHVPPVEIGVRALRKGGA